MNRLALVLLLALVARPLAAAEAGRSLAAPLACSNLLESQDQIKSLKTNEPTAIRITEKSGRLREVTGTIETLEILPGYSIFRVTDEKGTIHLVDPKAVREMAAVSEKHPMLSASKTEPLIFLEPEHLKKILCPPYEAFTRAKEYQATMAYVRKHLVSTPVKILNAFSSGTLRCGGVAGALVAGLTVGQNKLNRQRAYHERTFITEHSSNFTLGVGAMAVLHQCLSALVPSRQVEFLKLALGLNFLGNLYYEVNILGRWQVGAAQDEGELRTDLPDFASGMLGIASYAVLATSIESIFPVSFAEVCRGN